MPAFLGMTLTFLSHPLIFNDGGQTAQTPPTPQLDVTPFN
jgi:hypothetical protein